MQIVINIPKEFENHFNSDRFEDSIQRIKLDIKDMICGGDVCLSGNYEIETLDMLIEAFKECTPLPKGHGRLIDANRLKIDNPLHLGLDIPYVIEDTVEEIIDHAPTIIEADKTEREE